MSETKAGGLPRVDPGVFNDAAGRLKLGIEWKDDGDWVPEPAEIGGENKDKYINVVEYNTSLPEGERYYLSNFRDAFFLIFNDVIEKIPELRKAAVERELELTYREPVKTNFEAWLGKNTNATSEEIGHYKAGMREMVEVSKQMKLLYQKDIGYNAELKTERGDASDQELIDRYGHPWCIGDQGPLCVALPSLPDRGSGVFLNGVTCEEAGTDLNSFGNPFSAVQKDKDGNLRLIPYAEIFGKEQRKAAGHIRAAADHFASIPREKAFVDHLRALADAMEGTEMFPYVEADRTWHIHGHSDSIFLLRAGADEVGGDGVGDNCTTKARHHMTLGLINPQSGEMSKANEPYLQVWENDFADLIGDPSLYKAQNVVMSLPKFADVILATGDDVGGPNGTSIGQTLPNWCGEDGLEEPCKRRLMIFTNKTLRAYSPESMRKYIMPLFNPIHHGEFVEGDIGLESVVVHETVHNFGPQPGKPKPGTDTTYEATMGKWKGTFEELKAQTGSLYFPGKKLLEARAKFKAGEIDEKQLEAAEKHYRKNILYDMGWCMRMIVMAVRGGKFEGGNYSRLAAIQVGYLMKNGVLTYDEKNGHWTVHFENDKCLNGIRDLMQKVLKLYAEGGTEKVDKFVTYYLNGDGFKLLHHERIVEAAGDMPSVLFDYELEGI